MLVLTPNVSVSNLDFEFKYCLDLLMLCGQFSSGGSMKEWCGSRFSQEKQEGLEGKQEVLS